MAGVEQNRYKTNNGCIKHLPQTELADRGRHFIRRFSENTTESSANSRWTAGEAVI